MILNLEVWRNLSCLHCTELLTKALDVWWKTLNCILKNSTLSLLMVKCSDYEWVTLIIQFGQGKVKHAAWSVRKLCDKISSSNNICYVHHQFTFRISVKLWHACLLLCVCCCAGGLSLLSMLFLYVIKALFLNRDHKILGELFPCC